MNEIDKFFSGLPSEDSSFVPDDLSQEAPKEPAISEEEEPKEEDGEGKKNRRHRRWETRLEQRERDLIAREARAQALSEVDQTSRSRNDDIDPRLARVFGDTPEGKEVTRILSEVITEKTTAAEQNAVRKFQEEQEKIASAQKEYESFIDNQLETLEDEYNVDLTSDAPAARKSRREVLELVQKMRTAEKAPNNSRAKEIAAKTMQSSGSSAATKTQSDQDAEIATLRAMGIRI